MNWSYIAGFFDGEGSTGVYGYKQGKYAAFKASIAQSGPIGRETLLKIKSFLASEDIRSDVWTDKKVRVSSTKVFNRLGVDGRANVVRFLQNLLPYLYVKKTLVQDILRYNRIYRAMNMSERSRLRVHFRGNWWRDGTGRFIKGDCCGG